MSTIWFQGPNTWCFVRDGNRFHGATAPTKSNFQLLSSQSHMQENFSVELQNPTAPEPQTSVPDTIRFDRLQTSDEREVIHRIGFGQYVTREALVDEEYWTAAWLRAESHYEDRPRERYTDSYKRKFADQEFNALKRRCAKHIENCTCIVAFHSNYQIRKQEKNIKCTIIKSIVGTLDLNIRKLLQGEMFPGVNVKAPTFSSINQTSTRRYGYIANVCVSKYARRKSIASNMLRFAIQSAALKGVEDVFVHVNRENAPAQDLYKKVGFQMVEMDNSILLADENYLMRFKL